MILIEKDSHTRRHYDPVLRINMEPIGILETLVSRWRQYPVYNGWSQMCFTMSESEAGFLKTVGYGRTILSGLL